MARPKIKAIEAEPQWLPELPDPSWLPELPSLPWRPELPDPPWSPILPDPPWQPQTASSALVNWTTGTTLEASYLSAPAHDLPGWTLSGFPLFQGTLTATTNEHTTTLYVTERKKEQTKEWRIMIFLRSLSGCAKHLFPVEDNDVVPPKPL
ncbi:hypothetical protein DPX16_20123 [Anabarilius grahami]|uniref:Uncharacterized protein n=1 Tax=Anabarilius grahami TaxID=495550 RepID=A0A3N0XQR3_ANAGA|nr:hypothetical protein DPX16_20123 [Anabarilius grahami]